MPDISGTQDAATVASRIERRLEPPFELPGQSVFVTASIGIATGIALRDRSEALLRDADAAMYEAKAAGLAMSVNVSARQLQDASIVEDVESALRETGLDAGSLILELTGSAVVEQLEEALPTLQRLRWMSVRLAMDDFGTGYSSLSSLSRLPLDIPKIDQSLVAKLDQDSEGRAVVYAINSRVVVGMLASLVAVPHAADVAPTDARPDVIVRELPGSAMHHGGVETTVVSDAALASLAQAGDVEALAALLERHRPSLYAAAVGWLDNRREIPFADVELSDTAPGPEETLEQHLMGEWVATASGTPLTHAALEAARRTQWEEFYRLVHQQPVPRTYQELFAPDVDVRDPAGHWSGTDAWSAEERDAITLGVDRLSKGRSRQVRIHYPGTAAR